MRQPSHPGDTAVVTTQDDWVAVAERASLDNAGGLHSRQSWRRPPCMTCSMEPPWLDIRAHLLPCSHLVH